jgi:DNA-binding response OmpR family regulator
MIDVLIVDDNADIAQMLCTVLQMEGYTAQWARHGSDALAWLQQARQPPRALLVDLSMPEMDGPTFIRRLGKLPALRAIPIMVMSADPHPEMRVRELPVFAILAKPFGMEALLHHIQAAVRLPLQAIPA